MGCEANEVDRSELDLFIEEQAQVTPGFASALADAALRSEIRAALVAQRKSLRIAQTDVAAAMDTTQSSISEFEHGVGDVFLSTLQRYARAVQLRLDIVLQPVDSGRVIDMDSRRLNVRRARDWRRWRPRRRARGHDTRLPA
jgi:transcriptional regulator with XRE-family HTH domain